VNSLKLLTQPVSAKRVARIFEIKLMDAAGFMPEFKKCTNCEGAIDQDTRFSLQLGGLLCGKCRTKDKDAIKVSNGTINFIERVKKMPFELVSRIKVMSNLNIAEKRLPQDGRFRFQTPAIDLDLRVSFLPTPLGESVVIRLLTSSKLYRFSDLGLAKDEEKILAELIEKPHGIIFLTGPTGSGKTTTLYSCLSRVNTIDKKIITIEDPVEYQLRGITQIQINPHIGLTFAAGLRSMLRHDPDILLIRQFRHAADGPLWEVPAGRLDPGEAPEACALRELAEGFLNDGLRRWLSWCQS